MFSESNVPWMTSCTLRSSLLPKSYKKLSLTMKNYSNLIDFEGDIFVII